MSDPIGNDTHMNCSVAGCTTSHPEPNAPGLARDLTRVWLSSRRLAPTPAAEAIAPVARKLLSSAIERRRLKARTLALDAKMQRSAALARTVEEDAGIHDQIADLMKRFGMDAAEHRNALLRAAGRTADALAVSGEAAQAEGTAEADATMDCAEPSARSKEPLAGSPSDIALLATDDLPALGFDPEQVLQVLAFETMFSRHPAILNDLLAGAPCVVIEVPGCWSIEAAANVLPDWLFGPTHFVTSLFDAVTRRAGLSCYLDSFDRDQAPRRFNDGIARKNLLAAAAQPLPVIVLVRPGMELDEHIAEAATHRLVLPPLSIGIVARAIASLSSDGNDCAWEAPDDGDGDANDNDNAGDTSPRHAATIATGDGPVTITAHPADLETLGSYGVATRMRRGERAAEMVARLQTKLDAIFAEAVVAAAEQARQEAASGNDADGTPDGGGAVADLPGARGDADWAGKTGGKLSGQSSGKSNGRSAGKRESEVIDPSADDTIPRLEELAGYGPAATWGLDLARDIADVRAGRIGWREVDRGLVLAGPPGVGKTIFAKSLAKSCGVNFLASSFARWEQSGDGHGEVVKRMSRHFDDARAHAPCIMLIDEIDSIPDREQVEPRARSWWHSMVNAVLEQLDGALGREGVIVIGACNNPSRLDAALTRAGRLERLIAIPLPSTQDLAKIFRFHLKADLPEMDLPRLCEGIAGFTGGDVEAAVRSARRSARRAGRAMTEADLEAAVFISDPIDDVHLRRIAIHEAGHAIAAVALDDARRFETGTDAGVPDACRNERSDGGPTMEAGIDGASGPDAAPNTGQVTCRDVGQDTSHLPVQFITIRARGTLGGFVRYRTDDSPSVPPRRIILARVAGSLAGRAAEIVALGEADGGSGGSRNSDLASATQMLGELAARHGLGREGSLHWHAKDDRAAAIPEALRPAVEADLQEQMARVETIMRANRDLLLELADRLMIVKTMDAATFARDFAGRVKREEMKE